MTERSRALQMLIELQLKFSIQRNNALELAKWSVDNTINTLESEHKISNDTLMYFIHLRKELELL